MASLILIIPILLSFLIALFILPFWIRKARDVGLLWNDMNKINAPKVAGSGGIIVVFSFVFGVLFYIFYRVFYLQAENGYLIEIFALLTTILLLTIVGFIDDLFGWRKGGLSRRSRLILCVLASVPLVVINAGEGLMSFPFLGNMPLGLLYPLILIPIGIVGAATTFNFLAGFNGLEAGQGAIILSALALVSYFAGSPWLSVVLLCMVAALLAFLIFNFYPAKVFPGDCLTYPAGGLIAIASILGNFEKIAVFFFIPYILETILKSRGRLTKGSFGSPREDGSLDLRYDKIYGLTHLSIFILKKIGIKSTEKNAVYLIYSFQIIIIIIGFIIFRQGIFLN